MDDLSFPDKITIGLSGSAFATAMGILWHNVWRGARWTAKREAKEQALQNEIRSVNRRIDGVHSDVREIRAILMNRP